MLVSIQSMLNTSFVHFLDRRFDFIDHSQFLNIFVHVANEQTRRQLNEIENPHQLIAGAQQERPRCKIRQFAQSRVTRLRHHLLRVISPIAIVKSTIIWWIWRHSIYDRTNKNPFKIQTKKTCLKQNKLKKTRTKSYLRKWLMRANSFSMAQSRTARLNEGCRCKAPRLRILFKTNK